MNAPAPRLQSYSRVSLGDYPVDAVWSPDGAQLVVGLGDGSLVRLRPRDRDPGLTELGSHAGGVLALAWQSAGMLYASSGQDGRVCLWDARADECRELFREPQWSEHLAFAGNGKLLAVATGKRVRVYDNSGTLRNEFADRPGSIAALAWRPKGLELAAVANGGARIHRLATTPVETLDLPWKGACLTASWSPDGRILASGLQDGSVHFWYVATGKQSEMKGYGAKVKLTGWSANGRWLATSADEQIVLWDFSGRGPEGREPVQLRSHTLRLTQLAFAPQGNLLVSASADRRLLVWQPGSSESPIDADMLGDEIVLLRFSRDGQRLVVGDAGGELNIYQINRAG